MKHYRHKKPTLPKSEISKYGMDYVISADGTIIPLKEFRREASQHLDTLVELGRETQHPEYDR